MNNQAEIDLARQAKDALKNPALAVAFHRYRNKIVDQLQAADPKDVDMILTLKRHLNSVAIVQKNLEMMVADGLEAEHKLDFERKKEEQRRTLLQRMGLKHA